MVEQLATADDVRRAVSPQITQKRKSELGQFMTPASVARFMANMFPPSTVRSCRLLDAGAGVGALTCAFLDRWLLGGLDFEAVTATAYEIDETLRQHLERHLATYKKVSAEVIVEDYIEQSTRGCGIGHQGYTHAILNPPYKKINSDSSHRRALRSVGIETVNLYSAFVALAVAQAAPAGQIVAIVPRSFCNGPYYRPFRDFILQRSALRHIHLFDSRKKAFKDDDVLQENVIIRLERDGTPGPVTVTTSTDDSFADLIALEHPFDRIVFPDDPERFIHVPTTAGKNTIEMSRAVRYTLSDLGIKVSTGPVVDFRLKEHLRMMPEPGTVPLIYPAHLSMSGTNWPMPDLKKPNAIMRNAATEKWLFPTGFYCAVRRFSSKEEKRRVVASLIHPAAFGNHALLGLENHINVFHENKGGLPEDLARGLSAYLNTTAVDENFRRFNGHTQVNATDLRLMKYPSREVLTRLGTWASLNSEITQELLDDQFSTIAS